MAAASELAGWLCDWLLLLLLPIVTDTFEFGTPPMNGRDSLEESLVVFRRSRSCASFFMVGLSDIWDSLGCFLMRVRNKDF